MSSSLTVRTFPVSFSGLYVRSAFLNSPKIILSFAFVDSYRYRFAPSDNASQSNVFHRTVTSLTSRFAVSSSGMSQVLRGSELSQSHIIQISSLFSTSPTFSQRADQREDTGTQTTTSGTTWIVVIAAVLAMVLIAVVLCLVIGRRRRERQEVHESDPEETETSTALTESTSDTEMEYENPLMSDGFGLSDTFNVGAEEGLPLL
jgi:hypothetical protein